MQSTGIYLPTAFVDQLSPTHLTFRYPKSEAKSSYYLPDLCFRHLQKYTCSLFFSTYLKDMMTICSFTEAAYKSIVQRLSPQDKSLKSKITPESQPRNMFREACLEQHPIHWNSYCPLVLSARTFPPFTHLNSNSTSDYFLII